MKQRPVFRDLGHLAQKVPTVLGDRGSGEVCLSPAFWRVLSSFLPHSSPNNCLPKDLALMGHQNYSFPVNEGQPAGILGKGLGVATPQEKRKFLPK